MTETKERKSRLLWRPLAKTSSRSEPPTESELKALGAIHDNQPLRDMKRESWLERLQGSYEGRLAFINWYFCQVEEAFIAEREQAASPESFDQFMLQVCRNAAAGRLELRLKPEYHEFLTARSRMPLELPALPEKGVGRDVA